MGLIMIAMVWSTLLMPQTLRFGMRMPMVMVSVILKPVWTVAAVAMAMSQMGRIAMIRIQM